MAILELVVNQEYYGQLAVNRFHYVSSGTPAAVTDSFALIAAAGFLQTGIITGNFQPNTLAAAMQGIQSTALRYVSVFARNMYSVTDFYEVPYSIAVNGTETGEASSPALAYGFSASRVRTDIRRGQKRLTGVPEGMVASGGVLRSDVMGEVTLVATRMSETLTYDDEGNTITFVPAVLGLKKTALAGGVWKYEYFPTEAEQLQHVAQGIVWSPFPTVRTQVSRQYGRGV